MHQWLAGQMKLLATRPMMAHANKTKFFIVFLILAMANKWSSIPSVYVRLTAQCATLGVFVFNNLRHVTAHLLTAVLCWLYFFYLLTTWTVCEFIQSEKSGSCCERTAYTTTAVACNTFENNNHKVQEQDNWINWNSGKTLKQNQKGCEIFSQTG